MPGYGDGKQIRDRLVVEDTVHVIDHIVKKGNIGEIYNIGGNNGWENIEVVRFILQTLRKSAMFIYYAEDQPGHDRKYSLDDTKLARKIGFHNTGFFEEQLTRTIHWYVEHQQWRETIIENNREYQIFVQQRY